MNIPKYTSQQVSIGNESYLCMKNNKIHNRAMKGHVNNSRISNQCYVVSMVKFSIHHKRICSRIKQLIHFLVVSPSVVRSFPYLILRLIDPQCVLLLLHVRFSKLVKNFGLSKISQINQNQQKCSYPTNYYTLSKMIIFIVVVWMILTHFLVDFVADFWYAQMGFFPFGT